MSSNPEPKMDAVGPETEDRMVWRGVMAAFLQDETRLIDLEGAFRSSKTTACLRKVAKACLRYPGMHWWLNRYSDGDTQRQLKPQWILMMQRMGIVPEWDATGQAYVLDNGSRVFVFGVKAQDQLARYSKIRGLTLAGIYNDQSEELPKDVFQEFNGRLSQAGFQHQMLLSPNPPDEDHWLATDEFRLGPLVQDFGHRGGAIYAVSNRQGSVQEGRRYYTVPIYANAQNLSPATITSLEAVYPPEHPKHRSAVLGLRGMNVIGEPVYKGAFNRQLHEQPTTFNSHVPLEEAIDFGKHHPCVVWRQVSPFGQVAFLGGILGQDMYLEDFLTLVLQYRTQWFPKVCEVKSCCDPAGATDAIGARHNAIKILQDHGIFPRWETDANRPDVRGAMIERMVGMMRQRTAHGERFQVNSTNWLRISKEAVVEYRFLANAFEAGYVWDVHMVSVGSKPMRKPKKDGWFEHGMNCAEYLELNFGSAPKPKDPPRVAWAPISRHWAG
jgi:hypothetical protein